MNTECMYVLKNQTIDAAKDFCKYLDNLATEKEIELYPTYVSVAKRDFRVTPDYDGFMGSFTVKKGTIFVWAYGKDYHMMRNKVKGGRRCFPYAMNWDVDFKELMEDVWEYEG